MGRIGYGYGSECHLLRFMGRHRQLLDAEILRQTGLKGRIEWVDFGFDGRKPWPDQEPEGLEFLRGIRDDIVAAWKENWPQTGTPPNWDAVGWLNQPDGRRECLLVEAKAHVGEIASPKGCGAKFGSRSRQKITAFMENTQKSLNITSCGNWLGPYYQFANRVATMQFLSDVPARLICLYFIGDQSGGSRSCPQTVSQWQKVLKEQDREILGDCLDKTLGGRLHKVFLQVRGEITT